MGVVFCLNTSVVGTVAVLGQTVCDVSLRKMSINTFLAALAPEDIFWAKQVTPKVLPKVICTLGMKGVPTGFEQLTAMVKSFAFTLTPDTKDSGVALPRLMLEGTDKLQVAMGNGRWRWCLTCVRNVYICGDEKSGICVYRSHTDQRAKFF